MRRKSLSPHFYQTTFYKTRHTSISKYQTQKIRPKSSNAGRQQYQRLMKTMYIMSNIKKAVKENDLAYLIGERRSKLRTEPAGDSHMFEKVAHQALIDIRKKYDSIKRQRQAKYAHNQKLKQVAKAYAKQQNELKQKLRDCRISSKRNKNWVEGMNLQIQFKFTDRKVLEHMKQRLSNDIHFYKQQILLKNKTLQDFNFNVVTLQKQCEKLHTQTGNSSNVLMKLKTSLDGEHQERQEHLSHLLRMLDEKQIKQRNEKYRIQFQQDEAVKALLCKNQQQKNWESLLLVHLFLKKILQNKIKGQMQKFRVTQQAFRNIKSNTDTKDANVLVYKFLNREKIYGRLLTQVTKTKQKHFELKQQHTRLVEESRQLQEQNKQLSNIQYTHIPKYKIVRNPQMIERQARQINTMKIKLRDWLIYQLNKISKYQKRPEIKVYTKDTKIAISQLFDIYLQYLEDLQLRSQFQEVIEAPYVQINTEEMLENASFISINQLSKTEIKNASTLFTSPGNQLITKTDLRQNQTEDKTDEETYNLNQQRQEVHQMNQKFMKDLRVRYIQLKKRKL